MGKFKLGRDWSRGVEVTVPVTGILNSVRSMKKGPYRAWGGLGSRCAAGGGRHGEASGCSVGGVRSSVPGELGCRHLATHTTTHDNHTPKPHMTTTMTSTHDKDT